MKEKRIKVKKVTHEQYKQYRHTNTMSTVIYNKTVTTFCNLLVYVCFYCKVTNTRPNSA